MQPVQGFRLDGHAIGSGFKVFWACCDVCCVFVGKHLQPHQFQSEFLNSLDCHIKLGQMRSRGNIISWITIAHPSSELQGSREQFYVNTRPEQSSGLPSEIVPTLYCTPRFCYNNQKSNLNEMNPPPLYDYKGFFNVGMNLINHSVSKIDLTRFMEDLIFLRVIQNIHVYIYLSYASNQMDSIYNRGVVHWIGETHGLPT